MKYFKTLYILSSEAQSFNLYSKLFTAVSNVVSCYVHNGKAVWFGGVHFYYRVVPLSIFDLKISS